MTDSSSPSPAQGSPPAPTSMTDSTRETWELGNLSPRMKLWGKIIWTLLSGRRRAPQGWAFNSWKTYSSLAGLLSATGMVNHWTRVFEERGIPEARESSEYIVAHVLGAKTVKCNVGEEREEGGLWGMDSEGFFLFCFLNFTLFVLIFASTRLLN